MPLQIQSSRWFPAQYRPSSSLLIVCFVLAVSIGVLFLSGWQLPLVVQRFWLWIPALAPAAVILHHAVFLTMVNPLTAPSNGQTNTDTADPDEAPQPTLKDSEMKYFADTRRHLRSHLQLVWGLTAIIRDYTLPIVLNIFAGMVSAYLICSDGALDCQLLLSSTNEHNPDAHEMAHVLSAATIDGIRYGALGAYVYVLMLLGNRTFQRDITPGIAMWSGVQLLLGPILGGTAATILSNSTQLSGVTQYAVYFMAGLAPRELMNFLQKSVGRIWKSDQLPLDESNLSPLTQIRGITPAIIERLAEESITDTTALAMANPLRMVRDLPYEYRQVLTWMDEALLLYFLGDRKKVETLHRLGISGAIDFATYHDPDNPGEDDSIPQLCKLFDPQITDADQVETQVQFLRDLIGRMYEDRQVQSLWVLYQADFDGLSSM